MRWLNYAQERLDATDVKILTAPGNDDPFEIVSLLLLVGIVGVILLSKKDLR